jgi:4-amino-4-deoxy-L-arabinose transferase-like glycosyltransferase
MCTSSASDRARGSALVRWLWNGPRRTLLLLLLVAFTATGVFDHSLWAPNDTRDGGMIWDMFRSGRWTHASLNGEPILEKPPLLHWTALLFCSLSGTVRAGLVRLPAALYGLATLLIVLRWGKRLGRERAGMAAAFLCATSLVFAEYSRIVLSDVCLTFVVAAALELFWAAYFAETGRLLRYAAFLLAAAASFHAKGILGPGLVMTSVVAFLAASGRWRLALALAASFVPVLAAVVLPWAVALHREGGSEFLIRVFVDNQLGRFFQLPRGAAATELPLLGRFLGFMAARPVPADPYFVHKEPLYYYLVNLPVYLLPWTLLVPPALIHWFRRRSAVKGPFATCLRCAFVTIVAVLHLSSAKVACYALPLFPILFLMVGVWCEDLGELAGPGLGRRLARATTSLVEVLLFALPCAFLLLFVVPRGASVRLAAAVPALRLDPVFGDPSTWVFGAGRAAAWRGAAFGVLALAVAIAAVVRSRRLGRGDALDRLLDGVAALVVVTILVVTAVMPIYDGQRSYEPIAELVRGELASGRHVALAVGRTRDVGAFTFYADARLPEVSLVPGVARFLREEPGARGVVVNVDDLATVEASLSTIDHASRSVPASAGYKSREFRLITTD